MYYENIAFDEEGVGIAASIAAETGEKEKWNIFTWKWILDKQENKGKGWNDKHTCTWYSGVNREKSF